MMSRTPIGSALSAVALAALLGGCATPTSRSAVSGKGTQAKLAFATRAHLALAAGDFATAIDLAERAAENSPRDGTVRALLGNAYFGAGRFASAEAAYRDSLALSSNQPQLVLKLALVQIAQGKHGEANAFLDGARGMLDPADHGLALALAGRAGEAVLLLEQAARAPGADARVRQNLALAYGLSGDWTAARTVAEQDLSPDLVSARVQQWMALATPVRPADQVAALVGVTPAAVDPGQPVRLALRDTPSTRLTQAAQQAPKVEVQPAPQPEMAAAYDPTAYAPPPSDEPVQVASAYQFAPTPVSFEPPSPAELVSAPVAVPAAVEAPPPAPLVAALAPTVKPPKPASLRKPVARNGGAAVVVQLGAFSSPARVEAAWEQFAGRYGALRQYSPASARFDAPGGTVYRLSVKGFASVREASSLCSSLRSQGKTCFVRSVAGDAPVQFASS